jgi:hypothetical protein
VSLTTPLASQLSLLSLSLGKREQDEGDKKYARTTDIKNNHKFSPCFILSTSSILFLLLRSSFVSPHLNRGPFLGTSEAGPGVVKVSGHVQRHSRVGGARNQLKVIERRKGKLFV